MDVVLSSDNLLTKSVVHTSGLLGPERGWCRSPGGCGSSLGSSLGWELAELLLLLGSRRKTLRLRCWLPLGLRSGLEALGLGSSLLRGSWRRGVCLELTEGLPLLRAELLLLDGKVLLVDLEVASVGIKLVAGGGERSCTGGNWLLLLLRHRAELLLLRLDWGWPELLLRHKLLLGLRSRLEPLGLRLELLLLGLLEHLLLGLELLLLGLAKLLDGDGLACLVNELGHNLALGSGDVDRRLALLSKDRELPWPQLDGGGRTNPLLLGDGQGGERGDQGHAPHDGVDLTGASCPCIALYPRPHRLLCTLGSSAV